MHKILCSTGAIIAKPNNNDYHLLAEYAPKLNCDGFELMISSSWYSDIDNMIDTVNSYGLNIPVIHSQKSLGESLCGMTSTYRDGGFVNQVMTAEEDEKAFTDGTSRFNINLYAAGKLGAKKMVLHLWNGIASDKNIDRNIERFGLWKEMADAAGITLLVENVICNTNSPIDNVAMVAKAYEDACFVYDTKMAEFHSQTMKLFEEEYEWIAAGGRIKHLHVNDYGGGYMDWSDMRVLPIGAGHVDFESFFKKLSQYKYDGDFTVEATAFNLEGIVNIDMLNNCFDRLRQLRNILI